MVKNDSNLDECFGGKEIEKRLFNLCGVSTETSNQPGLPFSLLGPTAPRAGPAQQQQFPFHLPTLVQTAPPGTRGASSICRPTAELIRPHSNHPLHPFSPSKPPSATAALTRNPLRRLLAREPQTLAARVFVARRRRGRQTTLVSRSRVTVNFFLFYVSWYSSKLMPGQEEDKPPPCSSLLSDSSPSRVLHGEPLPLPCSVLNSRSNALPSAPSLSWFAPCSSGPSRAWSPPCLPRPSFTSRHQRLRGARRWQALSARAEPSGSILVSPRTQAPSFSLESTAKCASPSIVAAASPWTPASQRLQASSCSLQGLVSFAALHRCSCALRRQEKCRFCRSSPFYPLPPPRLSSLVGFRPAGAVGTWFVRFAAA